MPIIGRCISSDYPHLEGLTVRSVSPSNIFYGGFMATTSSGEPQRDDRALEDFPEAFREALKQQEALATAERSVPQFDADGQVVSDG